MYSGDQSPQSCKSTPSISRRTSDDLNKTKSAVDLAHVSDQLKNLDLGAAAQRRIPASRSGPIAHIPISNSAPIQQRECFHGADCHSKNCPFLHPPRETDVVYGSRPGGNLVATDVCKAGADCTNANCRRAHPNAQPGCRVLVRGWCVHGCIHHCTGMIMNSAGKTWLESKCPRNHKTNCQHFATWHREGKSCKETHREYLRMIKRAIDTGTFSGVPPADLALLNDNDKEDPGSRSPVPYQRVLANWMPDLWQGAEEDDFEEPDEDSVLSSNGTASNVSSACSVASMPNVK